MKTSTTVWLWLVGVTLLGCGQTTEPPGQVAQTFWIALLTADEEGAVGVATESSRGELAPGDFGGWDATVSFGDAVIDDDTAVVATRLQDPAGRSDPVEASTYLLLEDGRWRVDAGPTLASARAEIAGGFAAQMRALGETLQRDIENSMDALQEEMPEIRRQLESLGETAGELRDTLEDQLPELKAEIDELMKALEAALEKAEGEPP